MDDKERERTIRRMEERGHKLMAQIVEEDCYTREEVLELTGEPECNVSWNSRAFCKWLAVEHEDQQYWPKFQFDDYGRTPDGFDIVNAVLSHKNVTGIAAHTFWHDIPIDKNPEQKTCFELIQDGRILYVAKYALYIYGEQGAR